MSFPWAKEYTPTNPFMKFMDEKLPLPRLVIKRDVTSIDDFRFEDFEIVNYRSHPHIAAPVAV